MPFIACQLSFKQCCVNKGAVWYSIYVNTLNICVFDTLEYLKNAEISLFVNKEKLYESLDDNMCVWEKVGWQGIGQDSKHLLCILLKEL